MQILKRTKGIDIKARNTDLHGHASIELRDAITGKLSEKIEKDNMFTIGLDSIINKCPWGLNKQDMAWYSNSASLFQTTPIINQLLGGVTIYPNSLGTDANVCFPPFSNIPTGYASLDSYSQTDAKQGTYDGVSSGEITNGFRHVFDWGSAYGNGPIAAVALNPRGSYTWLKDLPTAIVPWRQDWQNGMGYQGFPGTDAGSYVRAASEHGIFYHIGGNTPKWCFARIKPFAIDLVHPYHTAIDDIEPDWELASGSYGDSWQFIGDKLANLSLSGSTLTVKKFDLSDGSLDSTDTYTFSASFGTGRMCITNGYFYCAKNAAGSIYKCNLANVADVVEIENTSIVANEPCYDVGSDFVYGSHVIIDSTTGIAQAFNGSGFDWGSGYPMWENGMWLVTGSSYGWYNGVRKMSAAIKRWGCMTHANLENIVNKDASKQMIVKYSVTQV